MDGYRTRLTGLTPTRPRPCSWQASPARPPSLASGRSWRRRSSNCWRRCHRSYVRGPGGSASASTWTRPGWFQEADQPPDLGGRSPMRSGISAGSPRALSALGQKRVRSGQARRGDSRTLEPLGLVLKSGVWYLVARVGDQDRAYRVSRILSLDALEEHFERPEGFDLVEFWQRLDRALRVQPVHGEATVRLSPRALELLPHYFDRPSSRPCRRAPARPTRTAGSRPSCRSSRSSTPRGHCCASGRTRRC